jgi:hypothetical protein
MRFAQRERERSVLHAILLLLAFFGEILLLVGGVLREQCVASHR